MDHAIDCTKMKIREIQERARCNNRSFRDLVLMTIDDPTVLKLGKEIPGDYLFRIHVLKMFGELTFDDCFSDMVTLDSWFSLAMDDLRGFCWCCALRRDDQECHHKPTTKCEWWKWDGFRRLNKKEG